MRPHIDAKGKGWMFRLALHRAYFEKGNGFFSVTRYVVFGGFLTGFDLGIYVLLLYGLAAYLTGTFLYRIGYVTAEIEVSNVFNLFVQEMRKALGPQAQAGASGKS